jgi:uncharacterized FlaG/YvyC family protein
MSWIEKYKTYLGKSKSIRKTTYYKFKRNEYVKWSVKKIENELKKLRDDINFYKNLSKINYPSVSVIRELNKLKFKIKERAYYLWDLLSEETKQFAESL